MSGGQKLIYLVTEDWYFCSHRLNLARAARAAGYEVIVVTRVDRHGDEIRREGFRLIPLAIARGSVNPFRDLRTLLALIRIYRHEKPALVHHVALKPVIYGTLAAIVSKVSVVVNALAGLGFVFTSNGTRARLLRWGVEWAFHALLDEPRRALIVQNCDDRQLFLERGMVRPEALALIRGSGVDLEKFASFPEPDGIPLVVLPARMLWDKGVREFVGAAQLLRQQGIAARFVLAGAMDLENPAGISERQLQSWVSEGAVEWWGHVTDMPALFAQAHIVCLPSYREGLPKALLEGAACARPLVATDVPGCREIVRDSDNGFLVPARDSEQLAHALCRLLQDKQLRRRMGLRGRALVASEFSDRTVIESTLSLYRTLLTDGRAAVAS